MCVLGRSFEGMEKKGGNILLCGKSPILNLAEVRGT